MGCTNNTFVHDEVDKSLLPKRSITQKLYASAIKNKRLLIGLIGELSILLIVFIVAWYYNQPSTTVTLIPLGQCGSCNGQCESLYSLDSQYETAQNRLNYQFKYKDKMSDDLFKTNYSVIQFTAQWSSCYLSNPSPFTSIWMYRYQSFDVLSTSEATTALNSYNLESVFLQPGTDVRDYDDNHWNETVYPPPSCFSLNCSIATIPGFQTIISNVTVPVFPDENGTTTSIPGFLYGTLDVGSDGTVTAGCFVTIAGVNYPFLTASNTVTKSTVEQCTFTSSSVASFGVALSYALSAASIIKLIHYFADFIRKLEN